MAAGLKQRIVEQLGQMTLYQDYVRAFAETTGLQLRLVPVGGWSTDHSARCRKNPFCELLIRHHETCAACLRCRHDLTLDGQAESRTAICFAGLRESSVPILVGGNTIGFLATGEVATSKPSTARFTQIVRHLKQWSMDFNETELRHAYFATRVMSDTHYNSILDLLAIFAGHLSLIADQLVLHNGSLGSPNISRAMEYIREHSSEPLDLKLVADRAGLSPCYFCRKFKETTGFTFTEYVSRTRVDVAKTLLLNPRFRISEVAFEVGFESLTHFNRVFREITGQSPTKYRERLPAAMGKPASHPLQKPGIPRLSVA